MYIYADQESKPNQTLATFTKPSSLNGGGSLPSVDNLLSTLREELARRGARGIVGLQRKFRIMDDNGDQALSPSEFRKAMNECDLKLADGEISSIFKRFDKDGDGVVDFEEFLQGIRVSVS